MSMPTKGIRLYRKPGRANWAIYDGGRYISTGTSDSRKAEAILTRYIAERERPSEGPATPERITVAEVLDIYGREHAPTVRDPVRIGYAISALEKILGSLSVSMLNRPVCRRYGVQRGRSQGTIRKELGVLGAAINYCHAEGYLTSAPKVRLPPRPPARDRWLTRGEVAKLIRVARKRAETRHVARFILMAVYTGSRTETILNMRFMPSTYGGWVDLEGGLMYRRGSAEVETKKRSPTIPLPGKLLAHLNRWERGGSKHVVEFNGCRVAGIKSAWGRVLKESGIEHCTKHDLRHTAITWALQAGISLWEACGYFGVSLEMIERTYGHHHKDYLSGAAEAMNGRSMGQARHMPSLRR